jgi:long-chain acyl-CoA synthetase
MKVIEQFHLTASRFKDSIAVFYDSGAITYRELSDNITNTANLLTTFGIGQRLCIGIHGNNSLDFIILAYAVMESGNILIPLSGQLSEKEISDVIETAGLSYIFSGQKLNAAISTSEFHFEAHNTQWFINKFEATKTPEPIFKHIPDPAFIRFTSGTTGASKGVLLSHSTIEERINAANEALQLGPGDIILWVLPMSYHFVVSIILYLRFGCSIILSSHFNGDEMKTMINKYKATFLYLSPMHLNLLTSAKSDSSITSVKKVVVTSTGVSKKQSDEFFNRYKIPVSQAYGIIEIGLPVINFSKPVEEPEAIGMAVADYKISILDNDFNEVPAGITGNLAIAGPGMLDAYLSPFRLRNEILQHGWFLTGDLASKDEDGLIKVKGRKKSMINVAGNKVFPEEVEQVLNQHPSIKQSRVSGYNHPLLGEAVQAEIIIEPGTEKPDVEILVSYCRKLLSPHKVPQKFLFVDNLPLTGSGKIVRN